MMAALCIGHPKRTKTPKMVGVAFPHLKAVAPSGTYGSGLPSRTTTVALFVRTTVPIVVISVATQAGAVVATGLAAWPLASCWHCIEACCCPVSGSPLL